MRTITATVMTATDKETKTGKKYQEIELEGDDRKISNWDKKIHLKSGDEIEAEIRESGDFFNFGKIKVLNEALKGTVTKEEVVQIVQEKSHTELLCMLACNAWNNHGKDGKTFEEGFLVMRGVVGL